jgi:hypothetical protein
MSNPELKIVYDSDGRAIVDKEVLDLLLKEHEELAAKQAEVSNLRQRLHWIWAIGVDYDGCDTVESLKELIDEMVELTQVTDEQVDDQLKAVKQLQQLLIELSAQKAELINQVQRLQKYDAERDERLHARLSEAAYEKGSKDTADRVYSYLYFLDKNNTENLSDKMLEWIKDTFGV